MTWKKWIKVPVFILCLEPIIELVIRQVKQDLGANPVEYITHSTGVWALRFLVLTLAITPLRRFLGWSELIKYRRMMGLFAFFYAYMHLMTYMWLDKQFDFREMWTDVWKRPFITAGFTSFMMMVPLAITLTTGWIRRMGGKNWQLLHRLVYISATAGVVHYYWLVKSDVRNPLMYAGIFALLLGLRLLPKKRTT